MKARLVETIESIRFDEATFAYESGEPVFKNLTLDLPLQMNVFVTGPSGNGQSTFLKLLAAILLPQSGKLLINGEDTSAMSFEEFLPFRKKIGYTFDLGGLFANRTLAENILLPLLYHQILSQDEAEKTVYELSDHFGFTKFMNQRPAMVPGGLRKLVCVLRALVMNPELVVMDDPFAGLGPESSRKLVDLIHEKRKAGKLKHIFLTSRDEFWPQQLQCTPLIIDKGQFRFEPGKVA